MKVIKILFLTFFGVTFLASNIQGKITEFPVDEDPNADRLQSELDDINDEIHQKLRK